MMLPGLVKGFALLKLSFTSMLGPIGLITVGLAFISVESIKLINNFKSLSATIDEYSEASGEKISWLSKTWFSLTATVDKFSNGIGVSEIASRKMREEITRLNEKTWELSEGNAELGKKLWESGELGGLLNEVLGKQVVKTEEASEAAKAQAKAMEEANKKMVGLTKTLADEINKATLSEYEYAKWALKQELLDRKDMITKSEAAEDVKATTLITLNKDYHVKLKKLEDDKAKEDKQNKKEEEKRQGTLLGNMKTMWSDYFKSVKEKYKEAQGKIDDYTDIVNQYTMDEYDYKALKIDEWYQDELDVLKSSIKNNELYKEALGKLDEAYVAKKAELDEEMVKATTKTWDELHPYWSNLCTDLGTTFGNFTGSILSTGSDMKDALAGLWNDIKSSFIGMITDMVADWVTNFLKKLVSETAANCGAISAATALCGASAGTAMGSAATTAAGAGGTTAGGVFTASFATALAVEAVVFTAFIGAVSLLDKLFPKHVKTMAELAAIEAKKAFDKAAKEYALPGEWGKEGISTGDEEEAGYEEPEPGFKTGGLVRKTGLAIVHQGEFVIPKISVPTMNIPEMRSPGASKTTNVNISLQPAFYFNNQVDPNFTRKYVQRDVLPQIMNALETASRKTKLKEILGVA